MATIKDILKLNLQEDIKNVIDLEDKSQNEIQSEIESYIITDGLGSHLSKFINQYTSNIKESGVWLSGFYGSGKSYFGKMLGYLIDNPSINGTSARDRFMSRLVGVKNQNFIENDIRNLDAINSKVVFLDIAKQNTDNGLAFTLFSNFLKSLGFRDDRYGFMEYEFFIDGKYEFLKEKAKELFDKEWEDIKNSNREIAKAMRRIYAAMDYNDAEYEETLETYSDAIQRFDASRFKKELEKYLNKVPDQYIVFIFDEASEAISQKKFDILDLEGISESLSSISNKVWTIAIAQEKLNDVIHNTGINKSQLTKVTDRFKTKIHLESTEVDVIIKNRLLLKKDKYYAQLVNYFKKNEGSITDATNLNSSFPTKSESAEEFATYYPFHKYQFKLLQNFLFSSNALVATQIAARGMIITTFDVLKKQLRDRELLSFTTAHDLCTEAQTSPPADLVNKYDNAKKILENANIGIDGMLLLKSLHFLNQSEQIAFATVENITKVYQQDITKYYDVKPKVEEALKLLVESKILILSNGKYKITSNLEGKLLEEMKDFDVELFIKKRELVTYLKKLSIFIQINTINEDAVAYNFNILSDLEDEIIPSKNKKLKFQAYSLFNINEERQDFIEGLKLDTQYKKDLITLVPDNSRFDEIDRLLKEVKQYGYMEEKYANDDDIKKRQIIRDFISIKEEKEKDLNNLIEAAYYNGSVIYLFDENLLNKDNFKVSINEIQRKLIKNIYTKRLSSQLSEEIGAKILSEAKNEKLHRSFSGDEFTFFDKNGNFVGDHLKVVEEISAKINKKYVDGKSLEDELSIAPWGYSFGTLSTALAVLFRAGRLVIKFNDTEYFTYTNKEAHVVFNSSTKFKNARYKSITKILNSTQKNNLIQTLLDLEFEKYTNKKLGWNVSDFEASDAITQLAEYFITSINTLKNTQAEFNKLFANVSSQKDVLQAYSNKTTEANYINKAEDFLNTKKEYVAAVKKIVDAEKFIKKNLDKIKGFDRFVIAVNNELQKARIENKAIETNSFAFNQAMAKDVIEQFTDIQKAAQNIKDAYYALMNDSAIKMKTAYNSLKEEIEIAQNEICNFPIEFNKDNKFKLDKLMDYCTNKIIDSVSLEYHIECQNTRFSLSDILNYIDLAPSKQLELTLLKSSFVREAPEIIDANKPTQPKKLNLNITKNTMTVKAYKNILTTQLQAMVGMQDDNEVEIEITLKNK